MPRVRRNKIIIVWAIVTLVVIVDQIIKIYVKTNFTLRESVEVTPWFYLSFIENNGMAYGMEFFDKYFLTVFRMFAVGAFSWMLYKVLDRVTTGFVIVVALIIAGALGNIIDCVFYGQLFTDSYGHVAQWTVGTGLEGYAPWFKGKVVDMFYFPLIRFWWPDWVPAAGEIVNFQLSAFDFQFSFAWPDWLPCRNEPFEFFKPIFNFADAAISVGVALLVLCYYRTLNRLQEEGKQVQGI